jgi:hypothetical protein
VSTKSGQNQRPDVSEQFLELANPLFPVWNRRIELPRAVHIPPRHSVLIEQAFEFRQPITEVTEKDRAWPLGEMRKSNWCIYGGLVE